MEKIEINNLTPLISVVSAGKSSFLNVIYNIDFLEVRSGICTKSINIIRYSPQIGKNPKFYHLILEKNENDDYNYFKDLKSEIIGKENIKNKIKEINDNLKNEKTKPIKEIFYLIEIGELYIIDKKYLNNYDLVDIPGLSEYKESEENEDKEMNKSLINFSFLSGKKNNDAEKK